MKKFSSQFKKQSDSIRMRASEKRELKEKLVAYMEYHPLPAPMRAQKTEKSRFGKISEGILSEPFFAVTLPSSYFRSIAGALSVLCILAVPFAAERSLPGDVLYPVKVQFNEEVRSTLSFTPYAKVVWETQRVERRIAEARLMALEGTLTSAVQEQFSDAIKTHTDAAQREIALMRETNSDEAAIAELTFASALAVQSEVLGEVPSTDGGVAILAVADTIAEAKSSVEVSQSLSVVSYESLLAAVELESTRAFEVLNSVRGDATEDEIAEASRRLEDVKRKIALAKIHKEGSTVPEDAQLASVVAQLQEDTPADTRVAKVALSEEPRAEEASTMTMSMSAPYSDLSSTSDNDVPPAATVSVRTEEERAAEALSLLTVALGDIQKVTAYLTDINVRQAVVLNDLVPVTPTTGERALVVKTQYDQTVVLLGALAQKVIPAKFRNKVRYGTGEAEESLRRAAEALATGDVGAAESYVREALTLAQDTTQLVSTETAEETPKEVETPIEEQVATTTAQQVQ